MAAVAARSCLRSATTSTRSAAARFFAGAKPKASTSPFRPSSQGPPRVFRSPVEMRSISSASMLPYHAATASALLTSMLSVSPRSHAWTPEGGIHVHGLDLFVGSRLLAFIIKDVAKRQV
ncbi:protein NUCLEAR FUSION DEFECTIVE 6, chloroplastic/mitochondrial-like isoform X2 [Olea europaea var. sylvestris]|uniref:protein NUCLEAR FUSION DEFECTIVE 6, chloroplastic/mitochondrial-like isoform X2 n=1 Tax=Olea europaea var. sylvestris TaxID=158386 RepID=UPI000C1D3846|nr:protein NUCLEAR FUSION DEFECTIVE 6, chloroplastic/mitochondrial-like isoform X2 [Olea europaea var. sylvestris]